MKCAPCACTKYGKRLEQPMPATVVIFSCHILRFSISLKYSARTEKSPQPGHHVGWSAAISFLVRPLRSPLADCVGALTTAMLPALRSGISVVRVLMVLRKLFFVAGQHAGAIQDFFNFPRQGVGFVDAANFGI